MPSYNNKYYSFERYAQATFDSVFTNEQIAKAHKLKASELRSGLLKNNGNGRFEFIPLPPEAQFAPLYGTHIEDINGDDNLDIMAVGNSFSAYYEYGEMDALKGLILLGNGSSSFEAVHKTKDGFYCPGDAKGLTTVRQAGNETLLYIVTNNNDAPQFFKRTSAD